MELGKCEIKAILADLGIFNHIQELFRHILNPVQPQPYSEQVYPKIWHIQNQRRIQNSGLFITFGYSELQVY